MRAVVTERAGDYDVMRVRDVAPPTLGPQDVLVRNFASGVCYHDHLIRVGVMKRGITFSLILGHEGAGVVEAVGSAVRSLRPGERVACTQWTENCGFCRYCRTVSGGRRGARGTRGPLSAPSLGEGVNCREGTLRQQGLCPAYALRPRES
jgi:aryl-alcohol dehydrogenase